jgi:hypothetical protein
MKHTITKLTFGFFLLFVFNAALFAAEKNAVYEDLVNNGVPLGNGKTIKLPEPVMADGLDANTQQAVLNQVGPQNKPALMQQFLRGKPNDWYEDKQSSEKGANPNDSIGRRIDLYFVAQGKLETVASEGFVKKQIKQGKEEANGESSDENKDSSGSKDAEQQESDGKAEGKKNPPKTESSKIEFYTPKELEDRKLTEKDTKTLKERYAYGLVDLLGKVQISGSAYAIETITPESLVIAFKLDHRFDKDPKYPNQYRLVIAPGPPPQLGDAKPYIGFGAYAKITKLQGAQDKNFVEYHILYDEPFEWFNGTTQLISKLDTSYKDNINKFRRNILGFQKAAAAAAPAADVPAGKK